MCVFHVESLRPKAYCMCSNVVLTWALRSPGISESSAELPPRKQAAKGDHQDDTDRFKGGLRRLWKTCWLSNSADCSWEGEGGHAWDSRTWSGGATALLRAAPSAPLSQPPKLHGIAVGLQLEVPSKP